MEIINIPSYVREIMTRIESAGHEAFIVGGGLRDALLGNKPHDWDVTTSASPEDVSKLFPDMHVIPTGIKHGTVTVISRGHPVEITTYRVDGEYSDSRRPDRVCFTTRIEDDLGRRDFTVNALAFNEKRGLVDLFGGRLDLENKIIRAVGDPEKRFTEDALRIMRAFRFSAQLDFEVEADTLAAAKKLAGRLKNIARERIGSEFMRLLSSDAPSRALISMGDILNELLPITEIPSERLALVDRLRLGGEERLALLLYGRPTSELTLSADSLRLSVKQRRLLELLASPQKSISDASPYSARLMLRHYGESASAAAELLSLLGEAPDKLALSVAEEQLKDPCVSVRRLAISGADLISLGYASGKAVGELLSYLLELVIRDPSLNQKERLTDAVRGYNIKKEFYE